MGLSMPFCACDSMAQMVMVDASQVTLVLQEVLKFESIGDEVNWALRVHTDSVHACVHTHCSGVIAAVVQ